MHETEHLFRIDLARMSDATITTYPDLTMDEAREFARRASLDGNALGVNIHSMHRG